MHTFEICTGRLLDPLGRLQGIAYSGFGAGKNNPALVAVPDIGPIPPGEWHMIDCIDRPGLGNDVIVLTAGAFTTTYGRSAFLIHGDSIEHPGAASHGCIVTGHPTRREMWRSGDRTIVVVCGEDQR